MAMKLSPNVYESARARPYVKFQRRHDDESKQHVSKMFVEGNLLYEYLGCFVIVCVFERKETRRAEAAGTAEVPAGDAKEGKIDAP